MLENKSISHMPQYEKKIPICSDEVLFMEGSRNHHYTMEMTKENMIGIALSQK
jgi:hypothetical protein